MRLSRRVLAAGACSALVLAAALVYAQGVGIFSRSVCTQITSPVVGQTFCFDQTANVLKVWNGSVWVEAAGVDQKVVNVRDYGAVGDGTTDDTTAVQNAITAAAAGGTVAGGTVYFPAGMYKQTGTWTIGAAVRLIGLGAGPGGNTTCGDNSEKGAIIEHSFNGTSVSIVGVSGNVLAGVGPAVENLMFRQCAGSGTTSQGTALSVVKASDTFAPSWIRIRNVTFEVGTGKDDWTRAIVLDGSAAATGAGSGGGLRDIWIENIRTTGGTNATEALLATNVANLFISNSETNLANSGMTITGPDAARQSAAVHLSHVQINGTLALDRVTTMKAVGGLWTSLTTTANTTSASLFPMQITNTPTFNATNSVLFVGTLGATGLPSIWAGGTTAGGLQFRSQYGPTFSGVSVPLMGTVDANPLRIMTNNTTALFLGSDGGWATGALGSMGAGTLNFASAVFTNSGGGLIVASSSSANLTNIRGLSASSSKANNLRGNCTFAGAATCLVAFTTNEPDANYFVVTSGVVDVSSKARSGFTLTATGTTSNTVDWMLIR